MTSDDRPITALTGPHCESYRAGHRVHWIQALHTANKPEVRHASWYGRVLELAGTRLLIERVRSSAPPPRGRDGLKIAGYQRRLQRRDNGGDSVLVLENHDPERLARLVAVGTAVEINDAYAIMRVGGHCFSVTRGPLEPCATPPAEDRQAQR